MTTEVLDERRLNRALLARQQLLQRARLSIPRALERLCGIQNQYAPNGYIRLYSCLQEFRRDALTRALERDAVVQGTLMRGTIHLVSARDYGMFLAAIRQPQRDWASRIHRGGDSDRAAVTRRVRSGLRGRAMPRAELDKLIADAGAATRQTLDTDVGLVRVPPSGTWERRRADRVALAEDRLPAKAEPDPTRALAELGAAYLRGFGPARASDVASFTGVPAKLLEPALATLRLRRFRDHEGTELLDVPRAPLPAADTPAPVRFLPTWDAALLVHARRTGVMPERFRSVVFATTLPPSMPTFLVDGAVAGRWAVERSSTKATLVLTPFEPLPRGAKRELEDEGEGLVRFHEPDAGSFAVRVVRAS